MNAKIRIYCTFLLLAIITNIFNCGRSTRTSLSTADDKLELVSELPSDFTSADTLSNGTIRHGVSTWSYTVYVAPKNDSTASTLISTASNQTYKVNLQKVSLEFPADKKPVGKFLKMLPMIATIIIVIAGFVIIIMSAKLIRNIRWGNIFVSDVANYLKRIGFLLLAVYIIEWTVKYFCTEYIIEHVRMAHYDIIYQNDTNNMYIIMGLSLLIISEIILMGKDLKDEHDLTV